jgi:hypothetical protein
MGSAPEGPEQNHPAVSAPARKLRQPGQLGACNEASLIDTIAQRSTFSVRDNQSSLL